MVYGGRSKLFLAEAVGLTGRGVEGADRETRLSHQIILWIAAECVLTRYFRFTTARAGKRRGDCTLHQSQEAARQTMHIVIAVATAAVAYTAGAAGILLWTVDRSMEAAELRKLGVVELQRIFAWWTCDLRR